MLGIDSISHTYMSHSPTVTPDSHTHTHTHTYTHTTMSAWVNTKQERDSVPREFVYSKATGKSNLFTGVAAQPQSRTSPVRTLETER